MTAINADLRHQESDQHVFCQAPHIIPPDNQYVEVPIELSDEREKFNKENFSNLVDMTYGETSGA